MYIYRMYVVCLSRNKQTVQTMCQEHNEKSHFETMAVVVWCLIFWLAGDSTSTLHTAIPHTYSYRRTRRQLACTWIVLNYNIVNYKMLNISNTLSQITLRNLANLMVSRSTPQSFDLEISFANSVFFCDVFSCQMYLFFFDVSDLPDSNSFPS